MVRIYQSRKIKGWPRFFLGSPIMWILSKGSPMMWIFPYRIMWKGFPCYLILSLGTVQFMNGGAYMVTIRKSLSEQDITFPMLRQTDSMSTHDITGGMHVLI